MKVDLHLHSNRSDGNWSPSDLVAHAIRCDMAIIALTDHDTVSGIDEALQSAGDKLEVIPAVEINTIWHDCNGVAQDVHILGYFIDRRNAKLLDLLKRQRTARDNQVVHLIQLLCDDGLRITMDLVRQFSNGGPIGKAHVTQAIVTAGGASDVSEAYATYYKRDSKYFVPRKSATPFEALSAIHEAGGISSIAHPGMSQDLNDLIPELANHGLKALEAYHSAHDEKTVESQLTLARNLGLLVTGGSDCHGPFGEHQSLMGTIPVPPDTVMHLRRAIPTS